MTAHTTPAQLAQAARNHQIVIEQGRYAGRTGTPTAINTSRGLATMRLDDGSQAIVQLANMLPGIKAYAYAHGFSAAADTFGVQYVEAAFIPTD